MAQVASPYGLRPVNLIGGQHFNGGTAREFVVAANTTAFYVGDLIALSAAGLPGRLTSTPTTSTAGVVGVLVGVRYVDPALGYAVWGQYLPANATSAGFTDICVIVNDDPDQLYQIQGVGALGTFNSGTDGSGWPGAVGKNSAVSWSGTPNTKLGVSDMRLATGTNGASLDTTNTLGFRVVDVVRGTETDPYPEYIVKFNAGVHSYTAPLGV